jgi:hypothetical protein
MGGTSTTQQTQQSQTSPWAAAMPMVNGIMGQLNPLIQNSGINPAQTGALNSVEANAAGGNPYAGQIGGYASSLLQGGGATNQAGAVNQNYQNYYNAMNPTASGANVGNNPALTAQLQQIRSDVTNQVNGQFAAAGRDMSGMNQQTLARGIAQGEAPVIAGQYNQDVTNQMNAANALYGAGNTNAGILSGLQQNYLANQGQGVTASQDALSAQNYGANQTLAAEAQRQGIPAQTLGMLAQIGIPMAGLGSTSTGTSNGTSTMSGAQQFATILQGMGQLMPKAPMSFSF